VAAAAPPDSTKNSKFSCKKSERLFQSMPEKLTAELSEAQLKILEADTAEMLCTGH